MGRFLGRSGEKRFSFLCSDKSITCNDSAEDDHGWDHVVEFPHKPINGVSADMQPRLPAVFVQTKSHKSVGLSITMKLSNAMNLAKNPNPCFVALATFPRNGGPATWHAVHVWGVLLERILKRARKESRDGTPEDDFHKQTFSFTMRDSDRKEEDDLVTWIEQTVRGVGSDYAAAKTDLVPAPQFVGNIKFGPLISHEQLIDHMLGLTSNIPVNAVTLGQKSLGIEIPIGLPFEDGKFTHAALHALPSGQADIRMLGPDGKIVELSAEIIAPPNLGQSNELKKVRFKSHCLDIVWSLSGEAAINGHFDSRRKMSPKELADTLRIAGWAGRGEIDLKVSVDDAQALGASVAINPLDDSEELGYLGNLCEQLVRVSDHLKNRIPQISIDDLLTTELIEAFCRFVAATDMQLNAKLDVEEELPEFDTGVGFSIIPIGEWVFAAIQRFPLVRQKSEGANLSVEFGKPILLERYAFPSGDEQAIERFKEDYRRHAKLKGVLPLDNALLVLKGDNSLA